MHCVEQKVATIMLCRALLAAVVFTYVLCVLVLSGVQKEDLDAGTIRKLQRHNVNIDDINDRQLRNQCLGKTDMPVTLTTPQANTTSEKTEINVTDYGSQGLQAEDTTPIQKIFEYLELMRKEEQNKALATGDNTNKSELEFEPLTKLLSSSFRERVQRTDFEDPSSETPLRKTVAKKKHDEKIKTANLNTELENLMNILRANINRLPDTTPQESSTVKIVKDVSTSKNTKDVDYITKLVEEIISKRQLKEVNTTNGPKSNLNTNETFREIDEISDSQSKNKSISLTNYYLNNCKLKNFYANNQGDKEKFEIFDSDKSLRSGINEPHRNANDNRFKAKEQKIAPDQRDNPIFNNILKELNKEGQRFKLLDKEIPIRKTFEPVSQTPFLNPNNDIVKPVNVDNEGLNIINEKPLENKSKSIVLNGQSDHNNISDVYNDELGLSDDESKKALQIVLQTQSQLFNQIFNQQRNLIKMCNTEKEKLKLRENESPASLQSALKNQLIRRVFDKQNEPMVKEEQDEHPTDINENTHKLQPKLEEKHAKIILKSPPVPYKLTKSDNDIINGEYKTWRLAASNTHKEDQAIETINNRIDDKFKTTNTLNGVEYDPNLNKVYKRPWFYAELSNKQPKSKINVNKQGIFFIPNGHKQITYTIDPVLKKPYQKSWSPYFDNNTSITKTDEYLKPKNQHSTLVDSPDPSLSGSNNRQVLRDPLDTSKTYPKIVGMYPNNIKSADITEEFETKPNKKTNQVHCQTVYENMIECLSTAEYKSDCAGLRDNHCKKQKPNIKDREEETEAFTNNIEMKSNTDRFSFRPRIVMQPLDHYFTLGRYKTNIDDDNLLSKNVTKESIKTPAFPPNVIKDIANSIKDFVLRDLKTTTTTTPTTTTATTTTTTTTISPTTLMTLTTTTTPKTTTTMPTTISTTSKSTTTEVPITTSSKNPLMIQDASKVLKKMMEMFEKLTLMKETIKTENFTHAQNVTTQKARTDGQERLEYIQMKEENHISHYPQPLQQNIENIQPYVPQIAQLQISNTENRVPYYPRSIQQSPEIREPYRLQPVQMKEESRLQYDSPRSLRHPENRVSYYSQPSQRNQENQTPYTPGVVQLKIEQSTPYLPQTVRLKTESRLPYDPLRYNLENRVSPDLQPLQRNPEDSIPNYLQLLQRNLGSNKLYDPQALQLKAENQRIPQTVQNYPENSVPYIPGNRTYVPDAFELKTENRMRYFPQALQSKTENQYPYELQPLQRNPETRGPYLPSPLKYLPQAAELQAQNRIPFVLQGEKTENHIPYNPPPLQRNSKDRPYDYSAMEPYRHSKVELDTNLKDVKAPVSQKKVKPATGKEVITVQTNSGEISPLKIVLRKPLVQNVILTTPPSVTVNPDVYIYNFRKPMIKSNRHLVEFKESEVMKDMKEDKEYTSRLAHKNTRIANVPSRPSKSRKTKKERDVHQRFVPRDLEQIRSFHEKLEGTDSWPREEEKIVKRVQRPIVKNNKYDDTHFRNFLQTQQKVNAMLEKILASGKTKPISDEVI